jgi:hypothetical protein
MFRKLTDTRTISTIMRLRYTLAALFCLAVLAAAIVIIPITRGANPESGSISEANPKVTWTGPFKTATGGGCGSVNNASCDNFKLTIAPPSAAFGPYIVEIRLQPIGDWDLEVYDPGNKFLKGSGAGPNVGEIVKLYNPAAGIYTIAAAAFAPLVGPDGISYTASAELMHQPPSASGAPGAENIAFTNHTSTSPSAASMGEPSIGVNWNTGKVMLAGGGTLKVLTVTFNDATNPPTATWVNNSIPISQSPRAFADPILFTDPRTGRTFAAQEEGLTPFATVQWSDNDGGDGGATNWFPSQGSGIASGIDHETIGGGPLAAPLTRDPNLPRPAYPNGVYYCAQELVAANCALSLDGGVTFGPAVTIYTSECGGLHGHVKVGSNDGTVYIPNKGCGGAQGIAVSEDNGITWNIRTVPGSGNGDSDPSVGIATDGTVYFGFQDGDGHPKVAVSHDKGRTWVNYGPDSATFQDVGTPFGIQNTAFPAMVAGDPNRAAYAFLGTPTAGGMQDASFTGVWHLYVAFTYDGGETWTTVDATPTDPVQRGCIWLQGGTNTCRNLLDFMDAAVDQAGRVVVGYPDGCTGTCATGGGITHTAQGTIARQSAGRRMFAAFDPVGGIATTTTLTSSPNPSTVGQSVTFTATVTAASGTPAGSVAFNEGGVTLGTGTLNASGQATFSTSTMAVGTHSISAAYSGDATFAGSASAVLTQTVNAIGNPACTAPGVIVVADARTNDATDGQAVHDIINTSVSYPYASDTTPDQLVFTIKVASLSTLTPGSIYFTSFTIDSKPATVGNVFGVRMVVGNTGTPTFESYKAGASNAGTVDGRFVSGTPTPAESGSGYNANGTITILVKPANIGVEAPISGKTLTLFNGAVAETAAGIITGILDWMPVGGDGFVDTTPPARDAASSFTVQSNQACKPNVKITTSTTLISSPNPSTVGQAVTFSATVSSSAGTPTGTVTFNDGPAAIGSGTVDASGKATFTTSALSAGSHSMTATYGGDANFASSTSAVLTQVVEAVQTAGPRFDILMSPAELGNAWGEPSIGVNWKSERTFSNSSGPIPNGGTIMSFGGFGTTALRVTCSDCPSPALAVWEKTAPLVLAATPRVFGDPILFTDKDTGRTLVSQLVGLTPLTGTDITDDDGRTWTPSQGSGIAAGIDHETYGGGPFHAPLTRDPNGPLYPNAVYYCSQSVAEASCAVSLDGGRTFGPAVTMYTSADCAGLHGHLKVGPDGTAYVPNKGCGGPIENDDDLLFHRRGRQAVIVSENNGATWDVREIPTADTASDRDPSVAVASDGTLYFAYKAKNGHSRVALSHDKGMTWMNDTDVGALAGVQNSLFQAAVAGDPNRASVAYFGTTTGGDDYDQPGFVGVWYLYISTTYDGGLTWNTINATPGDPIQRGGICGDGTCRNLLDFFDATVDKEGRVLVGYEDGCITAACINGGANDFTAKNAIARQSGGRRMFASFDPLEPNVPKAPAVTANLDTAGGVVHVSWTTPDHSGAPITSYNVYRRTGDSGAFTRIAVASGNTFDDTSVAADTAYFYRVTANNAVGEGPFCGEAAPVLPPPPPDPCHTPGVLAVSDLNADGTDNDSGQNTPPDARVNIRRLYVSEPDLGPDVNKLVFRLEVGTSTMGAPPPGSEWFTIWQRPTPDTDFDRFYVAMRTDAQGVPSFEYGKFGVPLDATNPNPNANTPVKLLDADSGSYDVATGTITITLSTSKAEGVQAGQSLSRLNVRTYFGRNGVPGQRSQNNASDISTDGGYTLVGNASCAQVNTPPVARDDSASTSPDASVMIGVLANDSDADGDTLTVTSAGPAAGGSVLNNGDGTVTYTPAAGSTGSDSFSYSISDGRGGSASANVTVTLTATPNRSLLFGHDTIVDFSATSGEPFVRVGPKNTPAEDDIFVTAPFGFSTTVSLLWKSIDDGKSFIPLGTPIVRDAVTGPGGGDTHMDFDAKGRLYYADLSAACVTAAVSEDGGNTFPPDRTNFLTCIGGGDDPTGAQDDRQWVAAFGDGLGYVTVRNLAVSSGGNFHFFRTRDAGRTWDGRILGSVGQSGPLQIDKKKRKVVVGGVERDAIQLYQIHTGLNMFRITDLDDGSMPTVVNRSVVSTGNVLFPVLSIDTAGNLYVVWSNGSNIFMRTSTDRGDTWSATVQVNPPSLGGSNIMPWIVAGDPGRVDIVWYHTAGANNTSAVWDIYMAQSLNALSATPSLPFNKVNETVIHRGEICLRGLNCDIDTLTGTPSDRSFLEFPSIDIDSRGAAVITFNDNTNQADGPGKPGGAYVMVTRQTVGPSLYASVGSVGLDTGSVTITQPIEGQVMPTSTVGVAGTHSLPPDNVNADEVGDAKFPDHGPVIGPNIPALDVRKVALADDASSVTVTMELGDLTLPALATAATQAGGDGVLYLTQWDFNDKVYWVAAEVRAGVPVFYTGTLGIIKSATSKKFITYNPDLALSQQLTGSITNGAPGTISIRIPRNIIGSPANGASFFTTTGYTMSERGPLIPVGDLQGNPDPSSLPIQVDANAPFTYVVSNSSAVDGVVEISLDDATFGNPTSASAAADGTWTAVLNNVAAGSHTAYARQHINGREASAAALVHFVVNSPPVAALTASPTSGTAPLTVNFNGSGSSDPDPGDSIASYTFAFGDGSPAVTQASPTISHTYNAAGLYLASLTVTDSHGTQSTNVATVSIQANAAPPPPCIEDNDPRIVYSGGWHLINSTSASDGHFRYHTGNSPNHFASLEFSIPSGSTGSITYAFAKSPKGGTADVYLDGVKQTTINYAVSSGSTQSPEFKPEYKVQYTGITAGSHKLEIKNMSGVVYLDQLCLTSSTITSQSTTVPGNTSNQSGNASAGQTTSANYQPQLGSQEMTVTAESSLDLPFKIVVIDPNGLALQTADAVSGIATLTVPVNQQGVYVIQVVNLSLGSIQFTVTTTPTVQR